MRKLVAALISIPIIALIIGLTITAIRLAKPQQAPAPMQVVTPSPEAAIPTQPDYTEATASPDGIGKFFHGREIAHVMGHPAIGWLERDNREQEEAPTKALALMKLKPDAVVADIGAGSGYYSFRISPMVPQGRVVAIDIQPEMLDFLKKKSAELAISNVEPHLGAIDDLKLPANSLDGALMVDAYHEFDHPKEMLASLFKALKPGGQIYLLEFRGEDPKVPIKKLHKMTEAQARLEFEGAGFKFVRNDPSLPWQHFLVFTRP
jgi:predicted methyltransferase